MQPKKETRLPHFNISTQKLGLLLMLKYGKRSTSTELKTT